MPLLARLRQLFDLDAEPSVIDGHLADGGLAPLVARRPGLRIPGAFDGFEAALRELLRAVARDAGTETGGAAGRIVEALGEAIETEVPGLVRLVPIAERVAGAGAPFLARLGVPQRSADAIVAIARAVTDGALTLEPGADVPSTLRALAEVSGVGERTATAIVMRALQWPDAFPSSDVSLQRAAGVTGARALRRVAERWRPWRAYAAAHLALLGTRR
jgi:AraC family transcriptional regulator of adaptative response / DNA-3-methyladenine glycosylase II